MGHIVITKKVYVAALLLFELGAWVGYKKMCLSQTVQLQLRQRNFPLFYSFDEWSSLVGIGTPIGRLPHLTLDFNVDNPKYVYVKTFFLNV